MYLLVITGIPFTLSVVADVGSIAATLVSKVRDSSFNFENMFALLREGVTSISLCWFAVTITVLSAIARIRIVLIFPFR